MKNDTIVKILDMIACMSDASIDTRFSAQIKEFDASSKTSQEVETFSRNLIDILVHVSGSSGTVISALSAALDISFGPEDTDVMHARRLELAKLLSCGLVLVQSELLNSITTLVLISEPLL